MQVGAVTVKDRVEVPLENKKQIPYDPAIPLLGIDPEKNMVLKDTHPNVHCSTGYNSQINIWFILDINFIFL